MLKSFRWCLFDYDFFNTYKLPLAAHSLLDGFPSRRNKPFSVLDKLIFSKLKFNSITMKFTEKSITQPGQAYSARDLIRRSLNGTMPAIFRQGSYDLNEDSYEVQESDDSFIDSEPQLEDLAALKDNLSDVRQAVDTYVASETKSRKKRLLEAAERQHSVDVAQRNNTESSPAATPQ